MARLPKGSTPKTREEAVAEAETDDEVEYHRLRSKAAALREMAERLPSEATAKAG